VPETWEELDAMMAFFHRPDQNMFGGALFRTQYFIAWEWWGRFHAKGFYPLDDELNPQINNEAGVAALEELIAASQHLYPGAKTNGLFENFEAYGEGNKFANIGWGGTQKYLHSEKSKMKGKMAFGLMPGGIVDGQLLRTPYFNWGWNYIVSAAAAEPEIGYLFTLYATSPAMSTIATRDPDGYFDPTRGAHYEDGEIRETYSPEFLEVHRVSMQNSIPDLYLKGQGEYFDELRVNLTAADSGTKTAKQALDDTASAGNGSPGAWGPAARRCSGPLSRELPAGNPAAAEIARGRGRRRPWTKVDDSSSITISFDQADAGAEALALPFNVALVLPAQLTMLAVVIVPTLIVIWLAVTDWQPTQALAWWRAEPIWFWNFYDLWYDERFINAVLRTLFVVAVCVAVELVLALGLALLFWRSGHGRK
jgi:hypothetical protein